MSWITRADLRTTIRENRLSQALDNDDTIFEEAAETAEAYIRDRLEDHFDTHSIFNSSGDERPKNVLQWIKYITIYFIYDRIPDELTPERVVLNYESTISFLDKVSEGIVSINLPRKIEPVTGKVKTKMRWGSVEKRSH